MIISVILLLPARVSAQEDRALILVDHIDQASTNLPSHLKLANLLGHFELNYDVREIDSYAPGDMESYSVTFYLGETWNMNLPEAFLDDAMTTPNRLVWINYNLWKLAWGPNQQLFENRFGFRFEYQDDTAGFDQLSFKGRFFNWNSVTFGRTTILNGKLARVLASATNGSAMVPYVIRSGNFYYVADNPLKQLAEDSQYLVFCEMLHEMVGIEHAENRRALVRIEDVDPTEDPEKIRAIADYLYSESVPFSIAVIPQFKDPLGAWGQRMTVNIADRPELVSALAYASSKNGTIIMHGCTHQYDSVPNPYNGVTGMDSEFYISQMDSQGRIDQISPVPEDSPAWVQDRIENGLMLFADAGLPRPQVWETPHYVASDLDRQVFASNFNVSYERFDDLFFPFVINKSVYGAAVIPENLGYLEPGNMGPQRLIARAGKELAVRDSVASFFYHSEEDIGLLKETVDGIKAHGYTFVEPYSLIEQAGSCSGTKPELSWTLSDYYWASMAAYHSGILSVEYEISNHTGANVFDVEVMSSTSTNGVMSISAVPPAIDVFQGASAALTLEYLIPSGVTSFKSRTYMTARDSCGNAFVYPAPLL